MAKPFGECHIPRAGLTVGVVGPGLLWRAAYAAALGVADRYASGRRIGRLLLV